MAGSAAAEAQRTVNLQTSGNPAEKKTVVIPRSLPELQQLASRHFAHGGSGRMRLFLKGRELHHPMAVADLQDGDVLTVRVEQNRAFPATAERVLSTHQADFVKFPPGETVKPVSDDNASTLTAETRCAKLEGQSRYATDFVKHPRVPRVQMTEHALYGTHFLKHAGESVSKSTYSSHYPWHNTLAADSAGSDERSALSDAARGHPFTGRSSYSDDFPRRFGAPPEPAKAACTDYESTLTDQVMKSSFDGMTVYNQHFVKHPLTGRQPSARPARTSAESGTFAGSSEYNNQYTHYDPKAPRVQLLLEG
jgi:hypothetical protein